MLTSEYDLWKSQINEEDAARVSFDQYRKAVSYVGDYDYKSIRDKQIGRELVFKIGVYTVAAIVAVPCVLTGNAPGALLSFSVASYVCGSTSVTGAITGTNPISGRTITSEERWVEGISGSVQVLSGAYGIYAHGPQAFANALNTPAPPIRSIADIVDDVNNGAGEGASGAKTGTVWDDIKATQYNIEGTNIPKSFELSAGGKQYWINPNGTKHMSEYATRTLSHGQKITEQQLLTSLKGAVNEAAIKGYTYNVPIHVGNWELIFSPARQVGQLPVIKHALYIP